MDYVTNDWNENVKDMWKTFKEIIVATKVRTYKKRGRRSGVRRFEGQTDMEKIRTSKNDNDYCTYRVVKVVKEQT